jgi:hypothetical protein
MIPMIRRNKVADFDKWKSVFDLCHCIDCQPSSGATYVTWGSVPREDLRVTKGKPRKVAHANRIRSFAACCGTRLFFEEAKDSETIDMTIASLT